MNTVTQDTEHPLSKLELDDIFLVSSACSIARDYNQSDRTQPNLVTVQKMRPAEDLFHQTRIPLAAPESRLQMLRFFVVGEVHVAKPGVKAPEGTAEAMSAGTALQMNIEWLKDEDKLASLTHVFAADYRCTDGNIPSPEHLGTFTKNVVFHVWAYWREAVHSECGRMRLPPITVPMLRAGLDQNAMPHVLTPNGQMPIASSSEFVKAASPG